MKFLRFLFLQIQILCWIHLGFTKRGNQSISADLSKILKKEIREGIHGDYLVINLRKLNKEEKSLLDTTDPSNDTDHNWTPPDVFYLLKYGMSYIYELSEMIPMSVKMMKPTENVKPDLDANITELVKINLFTKISPDIPFTITFDTVFDAPLNAGHATKILTHGWLGDGNLAWLHQMKDKHLINGEFNVVIVDWDHLASTEYQVSVNNTQKVGLYVSEIVNLLIEAKKLQVDSIHFIGHSLGAHVAGIAAKCVEKKFGRKIYRITGLDPAMPGYENPLGDQENLNRMRLDASDAEFVDVIHTCSGLLGYIGAYGHADFYPNNGTDQPGCTQGVFGLICHHTRSYEYYIESVNSDRFLAKNCKSWKHFLVGKCKGMKAVVMGHNVNTKLARGVYYLETNAEPPFALG